MNDDMLETIRPVIVCLRRGEDVEDNWARFRELVETDTAALCEGLNTRWLISVCDTYADMGTPVEQRNAMLITTIVNMEKVGQSYVNWRLNYESPFEVPAEYEPRKIKLWDGMTSMHLVIGDVTNNLFRRVERMLAETPHLMVIYRAVMDRIKTHETILGTMNRYHKHVFEPNIVWREGPEYDEWRRRGKI